ncbi:MAG: 50S ribosomal protein L13 [SAR202 cluster bacterium]|jgi:large subunit ribosomal protein L13|nr:50S ribosomal protein L13 [SAR202 cluster bacterium]MDP7103611.1 50S ribosomal protein L13 [SAR202 cluster bacterium]MDP7412484.1 50S ribosomal protein L13 [SAR202 cluster bacterium]HJO81347.1 50S ribosomal protein L13 [SAR202 cluster bacterium]|tara:strand:+ start:8789 stop:9241 length:453 start_codon:yes stop_codon:yes gene_type:complete
MPSIVKPFETKASDLNPQWRHVDAKGETLGRLATQIAMMLMGKDKPLYVPHMMVGDFVVVTNAELIRVTGDKVAQKRYYTHSGYIGGLKERTLGQMLARNPDRVIRYAVKGMLPKNALGRKMLLRLKVYAGPEHPHQAQFGARKSQEQES